MSEKSQKEKLKKAPEKIDEKIEESDEDIEEENEDEHDLEEVLEREDRTSEIEDFSGIDLNHISTATGWEIRPANAPVLEDITSEQEGPRFVRTGRATTLDSDTNESSETTYIPTSNQTQDTGTNYDTSQEQISVNPERVNTNRVMFDTSPRVPNQETFFMQSRETGFGNNKTESIRTQVQSVDTAQIGRRDPFQTEERKYEKYEPDRPSTKS